MLMPEWCILTLVAIFVLIATALNIYTWRIYSRSNDDWITWNGGKCPVPLGSCVEIKLKRGDIVLIPDFYDMRIWQRYVVAHGVVAYRVVKG